MLSASIKLIKSVFYVICSKHRKHKMKGKTKYFCVGRNKTGTTSLKKTFEDFGYVVGDQIEAELLYDKYYFDDVFEPIIKYCETAEVFQDVPFSHCRTLEYVDKAFPGSKFILTVRDNADQWYKSITRFHAKGFGVGKVPTSEDLRNANYVRKGFMYNTVLAHGTPDHDPYNKEIMIMHYMKHNQYIIDYFKDRPDDLLVINLAEASAYQRFCAFIGINSLYTDFPWENKTDK